MKIKLIIENKEIMIEGSNIEELSQDLDSKSIDLDAEITKLNAIIDYDSKNIEETLEIDGKIKTIDALNEFFYNSAELIDSLFKIN